MKRHKPHHRQFLYLLLLMICWAVAGYCEEPLSVTVCQLKNDPPAFNHKLVEVSGFVSHAFEDFSLFDPMCPSWPGIWLEYGGESKSGTMYCCGVTADRHRPKELVIEDIAIPLVINEQFKQFDKAIQPPFRSGRHGAEIHATLIGRFFAGKPLKYFKGNPWGGFGHMGCCTLLAIQEIKAADTANDTNLDYGADPDQPDIEKTDCGYRDLLPIDPRTSALMQWQQEADAGMHDWAFDDPKRVASETLTSVAKMDKASPMTMKLTREAQGRKVYELQAGPEAYMVVVSRPYWLSFYSHDRKRVAWAAIAAYDSSCSGKHSVTRAK